MSSLNPNLQADIAADLDVMFSDLDTGHGLMAMWSPVGSALVTAALWIQRCHRSKRRMNV